MSQSWGIALPRGVIKNRGDKRGEQSLVSGIVVRVTLHTRPSTCQSHKHAGHNVLRCGQRVDNHNGPPCLHTLHQAQQIKAGREEGGGGGRAAWSRLSFVWLRPTDPRVNAVMK